MRRDIHPLIRQSFLAILIVSASLLVVAQSAPRPLRGGNPDAAKIQNPVPYSPESVSAGRRPYTQFCANCHGPTGRGDGASAGADQPSDLTDSVWDFGSTDGDLYAVIRFGITGKDMGGYAERLSETDMWNVVNYVRSLAKK